MKHIDIVIPTRGRKAKVIQTLNSIFHIPAIDVSVVIVEDGERLRIYNPGGITVLSLPRHSGAVVARNYAIPHFSDGVLYATDDIEFQASTFAAARELFNKRFPDDDGVVGIGQTREHNPAGVALVGRKFLDRYPGRMLFYPGYYHFACQEVHWLAEKVGKWAYLDGPWVHHHHPCFEKDQENQTHFEARKHQTKDQQIQKQRKAKGLIWGYGDESIS